MTHRLWLVLLLASLTTLAGAQPLEALDDEDLSSSRLDTRLGTANAAPDAGDVEEQQRLLPSEHLPARPPLALEPTPLPAHDPAQFARDLSNIINQP
ncbi:MAG: hypothetical protein ACK4SX_10470 [Alcanivoracaceae bacterium]